MSCHFNAHYTWQASDKLAVTKPDVYLMHKQAVHKLWPLCLSSDYIFKVASDISWCSVQKLFYLTYLTPRGFRWLREVCERQRPWRVHLDILIILLDILSSLVNVNTCLSERKNKFSLYYKQLTYWSNTLEFKQISLAYTKAILPELAPKPDRELPINFCVPLFSPFLQS